MDLALALSYAALQRAMARLSEQDLRELLGFLRTCHAYPDVESLRAGMLPALRELIPCDSVAYNEVDPATGETFWILDPGELAPVADAEAFRRNVAQHPTVAYHATHPGGHAMRLSDFVTQRQLHALELYDEFFVPLEIEHQLVITIPVPGRRLVGIPLHRKDYDINEHERTLLDTLRPHLVQLYRTVEARTNMQRALALVGHEGGPAVILLSSDTRPQFATDGAHALLERYLGGFSERLSAWVADASGSDSPQAPLVAQRGDDRLTISFVPAGAAGEHDALLLEESRGAPAAEHLAEMGLTPRESEVLAAVAGGRTDIQVAYDLGISVRTVQKHLERVYEKMGVCNRTAAAARARTPRFV